MLLQGLLSPSAATLVFEQRLDVDARQVLVTERDEIYAHQRKVQRRVRVYDRIQHLNLISRVEVRQPHFPHLGAGEAHAVTFASVMWRVLGEGGWRESEQTQGGLCESFIMSKAVTVSLFWGGRRKRSKLGNTQTQGGVCEFLRNNVPGNFTIRRSEAEGLSNQTLCKRLIKMLRKFWKGCCLFPSSTARKT